jgi:hypothetical protein
MLAIEPGGGDHEESKIFFGVLGRSGMHFLLKSYRVTSEHTGG